MAISTRAIKSKIKAVGNIRKITKAMELVAASKMKKATDNAIKTREYSEEALNLLLHISGERQIEHPLLKSGKGDKTLMIVISSNKGLCGGFNTIIAKEVRKYADQNKEEIDFITIGKRSERTVKKMNRNVLGSFLEFGDNPRIEEISGLTKFVIDEFLSGSYKKVMVVYANYISAIKYEPVAREILPINKSIVKNIIEEIGDDENKEFKKRDMALYLFEPDEEEVLNLVLPRLTESVLYQALLESLASEHSARMFAMKNASDNATEVLDDLTLTFNYARQSAVTQEISEIAAAANALN